MKSPDSSPRHGVPRALVLQGGGALGAYQAGVYQVLGAKNMAPDWVAGVSIGAINAALIAGNPPARRLERLQEFWAMVSSAPSQRLPEWMGDRSSLNQFSASVGAIMGIPGFFTPRITPAWMLGPFAPLLSYCDTEPLRQTLERMVDFRRINTGDVRVSVGAVNVKTGNSVYFDNRLQELRPEHFMASGALPPGFAPVEVDGEQYWDGGIVSNTPLQYVLDNHPKNRPLDVVQVDLFSARGPLPGSLPEVMDRLKDISYSSRTRMNTDLLAANVNLQQAIAELIAALPPELRNDAHVKRVRQQLEHKPINIYHLIYRDKPYECESKDHEFSRSMVQEHWQAGYHDMQATLAHPEGLMGRPQGNGITTFDLGDADAVQVKRPASAEASA